jgi:hypothetical protein
LCFINIYYRERCAQQILLFDPAELRLKAVEDENGVERLRMT